MQQILDKFKMYFDMNHREVLMLQVKAAWNSIALFLIYCLHLPLLLAIAQYYFNIQTNIMQPFDSKSIRQLLQDPCLTIEDLLDRQDFSSDVRNQAPHLVQMLNYSNMKKIMEWLIRQGPEDSKQSYKFPLVASEVAALETPNINEYLFCPGDDNQPLFQYLYRFADDKDNYVLAGYFSKVLIAIIKRHSNVQSKYNQTLCKYFFEQGYLQKLIKHLYSKSIIDLVLRIFGLRTKDDEYYAQKQGFVLKVVEMMENQQLSDEIVENVVLFIEALTTYQNSNQKSCDDVREMIYSDKLMKIVFGSLGNSNRVRKSKAKIVNIYLKKLRNSAEYILYRQMIEEYLGLVAEYIKMKAKQKSKVTLEETYIVDNLQTILLFPFSNLRPKIIECLDHLFDLILCNGWNNIFHQQILKIVSQLISKSPSNQLVTALTSNLIKFQSVPSKHYSQQVGYTEFIMKIGQQLIDLYSDGNFQKSKQWIEFSEGIQEMLDVEKDYQVGEYAFKPHTIAFAYSKEMALKQYAQFLSVPTIILYEAKQESKKQKEADQAKEDVKQNQIPPANVQTTEAKSMGQAQVASQQQQISEHYLVQPRPIIQTPIAETTIGESEREDNQMLQYWRRRMHYSLQQLMNDV